MSELAAWFDEAPTYSTGDAARLCGLPAMTLHRLAAAGVITATVPANGQGSRRRWSELEVSRLCRIGDVYRHAHTAGVLLTWQAVAEMWQTLAAGDVWRLSLTA